MLQRKPLACVPVDFFASKHGLSYDQDAVLKSRFKDCLQPYMVVTFNQLLFEDNVSILDLIKLFRKKLQVVISFTMHGLIKTVEDKMDGWNHVLRNEEVMLLEHTFCNYLPIEVYYRKILYRIYVS